MAHEIIFHQKALFDLADIAEFIEERSGATIADRHVANIISFCRRLDLFPVRGQGFAADHTLRLVTYRKSTRILFRIEEDKVVVLGIFARGLDLTPKLIAARLALGRA